jgi:hypothetical protein
VQLFKIYLCLHHLSFGKFANHVCVTVTERCLMIGAANMAAPTLFQKARISNPTNALVLLTQRESGKPDFWCCLFHFYEFWSNSVEIVLRLSLSC